jgi:hypothetical protein
VCRSVGSGKLETYIYTLEVLSSELLGIILIDNELNLMATLSQNTLNLTAHLAVTYNRTIHI